MKLQNLKTGQHYAEITDDGSLAFYTCIAPDATRLEDDLGEDWRGFCEGDAFRTVVAHGTEDTVVTLTLDPPGWAPIERGLFEAIEASGFPVTLAAITKAIVGRAAMLATA